MDGYGTSKTKLPEDVKTIKKEEFCRYMIQYGGDVGTSKTVFSEITLTMKSVLLN